MLLHERAEVGQLVLALGQTPPAGVTPTDVVREAGVEKGDATWRWLHNRQLATAYKGLGVLLWR